MTNKPSLHNIVIIDNNLRSHMKYLIFIFCFSSLTVFAEALCLDWMLLSLYEKEDAFEVEASIQEARAQSKNPSSQNQKTKPLTTRSNGKMVAQHQAKAKEYEAKAKSDPTCKNFNHSTFSNKYKSLSQTKKGYANKHQSMAQNYQNLMERDKALKKWDLVKDHEKWLLKHQAKSNRLHSQAIKYQARHLYLKSKIKK